MLPNRLIITKKSKREEIYKKSEKKWIIDFEDKIKSWSNFYDIVQKEMDFYMFYVNLLSKKENQDKKVLVGFNGIDGKEVTISKLKDDINEIRDSKSTFI